MIGARADLEKVARQSQHMSQKVQKGGQMNIQEKFQTYQSPFTPIKPLSLDKKFDTLNEESKIVEMWNQAEEKTLNDS